MQQIQDFLKNTLGVTDINSFLIGLAIGAVLAMIIKR